MRLKGKRAIVTGAASGIGRASAVLFASEGAAVVASDVSDAVEGTRKEIEQAGGRCIAVRADAADENAVRELVATCVRDFGGLEVVYANAGIGGGLVPFFEQTVADWEQVLRVNLIGPFLAIKHGAAHMREHGGGSIVCTASVAGLRSGAGGSPYSASKAGVISLVQTAANQLAGTNVRVNAICPGLTETGMTKPIFDFARARGSEKKIGQLNPLKRYGLPIEIAHMALFLASDDSSYVNGQAFAVDGGLSSSHPVVPGKLA
jgi:NAD(P)-dependent dehydrogenase (short-subunit alcohol dehydrogenase family)